MKYLQQDDDFRREYEKRLKELDESLKALEETTKTRGDRDAVR